MKIIVGLAVNLDYSACYYEGDIPGIKLEVVKVFKSEKEKEKYLRKQCNLPYSKQLKYIDEFLEVEFED